MNQINLDYATGKQVVELRHRLEAVEKRLMEVVRSTGNPLVCVHEWQIKGQTGDDLALTCLRCGYQGLATVTHS